jgi:TonB family protein
MVTMPSTVGILNPAIILPESLLQHVEDEVLTTAIGHELVHVARRDYLLNLIYEFIYLPLSFHPAATLVRRRIKQTRELCCDESVASGLLQPEIYARSLVRLIGAVSPLRHASADTTIGINESDILEVRIMTLLKTRKLTARRKGLSLVVAAFLLAAPCIAATSFALNFEIDQQEPTPNTAQASSKLEQDQVRERMGETRQREELKRAVEQLKEQIKVAPESKRAEVEARLREVQQNLELHERALEQYKQTREEREKRLEELRATLAQYESVRPADEVRMKEAREQIAQLVRLYTSEKEREVEKTIAELHRLGTDRKPRVIYKVEPEYTEDAREKKIEGTVVLTLTVDHQGLPQNIQVKRALYPSLDQSAIEAARKMRFQPAMKDGQPASTVITVEFHFDVDIPSKEEFEATKKRIQEERESQGESAVREMRRRKEVEQQGREERARKQAELTRGATLSMDRAIQIATSQVPGKVLACSLGRDGDKIFYHVVIIGGDGDKTTATYVWVSATDGQILKTEKEKEERKEEFLESRNDLLTESGPNAPIQGGVLNGKATSLPPPAYPAIARQVHASGAVNVHVLISEGGQVISAHAVSGHPLLQAAAVTAARQAKFTPTRMSGEPVRVSGMLVYNFVSQ